MVNESVATTIAVADQTIRDVFFVVVEPILIVLAGVILARLLSLTVNKVLGELRLDRGVEFLLQRRFSVTKLIAEFITTCVYIGSVVVALAHIGVLGVVARWTVLVLAGFGAVAALLKVGDVFIDLLAYRVVRGRVREDDVVSMGCVDGTVVRKGLLGLTVRDGSRDVFVPNRYVKRRLK